MTLLWELPNLYLFSRIRTLCEKCPNTELFLVRPYITPYLDTFHAVENSWKGRNRSKLHNNIVGFKSWFIYQQQKTILKIEFPKL